MSEITGRLATLVEAFRSSESISWKMKEIQKFVLEIQLLSIEEYELDDLLETLDLGDFSSARLKLELANRLHRPLLILELLKAEDKLLVGLALKLKWMFQMTYDSPLTKPKTLVKIVLPTVSYRTRRQIIKNLTSHLKDEDKCGQIFRLVREKFGDYAALPLLPACSVATLRKIFINEAQSGKYFASKLRKRQLLKIAEKDGDLAFEILSQVLRFLKACSSSAGNNLNCKRPPILLLQECKATLEYLCITAPEKCVEFFETWRNVEWIEYFSPTARTTKALLSNLNSKKRLVLNGQAQIFEPFLLDPFTVNQLLSREEFTQLLENLLPETIEEFVTVAPDFEMRWINILPDKESRWMIYNDAFTNKYGKSMQNFPEYVINMSSVMKANIPVEIRQELSKSVFQCLNGNGESYSEQVHADLLWTMGQQNFEAPMTSNKLDRLFTNEPIILKSSIKSCFATEDITLIQIANYLKQNNVPKLRNIFLFEVTNHLDKKSSMIRSWKKVTIENKTRLLEILEKLLLQSQPSDKATYLWSVIIGIKLSMNIEINEETQKYMCERLLYKTTEMDLFFGGKLPNILKSYENYEKFLILHDSMLEKVFPLDVPIEQFNPHVIHEALLFITQSFKELKHRRKKWTRKHFSLSTYPWTQSRLIEFLVDYPQSLNFDDISHIPNISELLSANINTLKISVSPRLMNFLLLTLPENLDDQFIEYVIDQILITCDLKPYNRFLWSLKTLGFSKYSAIIVETCLETAQDDSKEDQVRCNAITILSILWEPANFANSLSLFYPDSSKIQQVFYDVNSQEEFQCKFFVRNVVLQSIKNVVLPTKCISVLNNFFIGDFAIFCMDSLSSTCRNISQIEAVKLVKENFLHADNVSVKRKVVSLLLDISQLDEVHEVLLYLWDNEVHPKIREFVVKKVIEFICNVEFDLGQNMFKLFVPIIKEFAEEDVPRMGNDDTLFLTDYTYLSRMSKPTLLWYLQTLYFAPEKVPVSSMTAGERRDFLKLMLVLGLVHNNLYRFPSILVSSVVDNNLANGEDAEINEMEIKLMVGESDNTYTVLVKWVMKLKQKWDLNDLNKLSLRTYVWERCKFCISNKGTCNSTTNVVNQLESFQKLLETQFDAAETFTERIILQFTIMTLVILEENGGVQDFTEMGKRVGNNLNITIKECGMGIVWLYSKILKKFFQICEINQQASSLLDFLVGVLHGESQAEECVILAAILLPKTRPKTQILMTKYDNVKEKLKSCPTVAVKVVLSNSNIF
ncbi:uncharacterized protein LOC118436531 [Folsomia candida]|uniref:Uncharacterized protein n=1 Tax=Folsomia candida TaxID=158441 RepID=A0A226DYZ4_FOLCA|nr:uncharacterized protein LOC118436531 [Folsomia candida]OXA50270.1 hypothetical protein Fcan01_14875 [Folsomia candida]